LKEVTRTELVWAGKYDEKGQLRPVERTILPFQVVETVNESKADREKVQRDLFTLLPRDDTWRNMLIWGDNKVVMSSLLPRFAGKINLIYIDPPFATGQDFSFRVQVGGEEFVKEPSIIEEKAYRDTWGRGLDSYLQMMYERLVLMQELLAENGLLWVHLDWRVGHHVKVVLDELFPNCFVNQAIWRKTNSPKAQAKEMGNQHDLILVYVKQPGRAVLKQLKRRPDEKYLKAFRYDNGDGKGPYQTVALVAGSVQRTGGRKVFEWHGVSAPWLYSKENLDQMWEQGLIVKTKTGGFRKKVYLSDIEGPLISDLWVDDEVNPLQGQSAENLNFPTQKPESLLRRIISMATEPNDLIADFFCGSGTTLAVAEKLGRRWIGCDLSKWAIQVTRKRLLQIEGCKPFDILNLGNYERHKLAANGHWERYVQFILELYRAEPITGFRMLHGRKARAYVHVGSVDSPVTMREIRQTLREAQDAGVREVHFLGWDFEMGLHDVVSEVGDDHGVKVRLVSIPKEALEVAHPAREEVRFFDLNYLDLEHEVTPLSSPRGQGEKKGGKLTIRLKDFIIANPEYLPDEVRAKIKKFTDYIDYWAVDWDYREDTFHNQWQSFRTRKNPKLGTKATHTLRAEPQGEAYEQPGTYKVLVKVVDIFGNDTTKMVEVEIK